MRKSLSLIALLAFLSGSIAAESQPATWLEGESIPEGGRPNPLAIPEDRWPAVVRAGRGHALVYPVAVTGALLPYESVKRFLDEPSNNPVRALLQGLSVAFSRVDSFASAMDWLGLAHYPADAGQKDSDIPLPGNMRPGDAMGLSLVDTEQGRGFTFSCASCHVGNLFGRPVLGLTNRFPRANALFIRGKVLTQSIPSPMFALAVGATPGERQMYRRTRHNMFYVNSKRPEVLGLDTSLAHVALSLALRSRDAYATKDPEKIHRPDDEVLATFPADSKPAVWWSLKYKNRWLSDGSVLSGNPIVTNILWNEIGRGTDLRELEEWIDRDREKVDELTAAVFAAKAPRITDFIPAERIDLEAAKRGQIVYSQHCAKCHGRYEKAWDLPGSVSWPLADQLRTVRVVYHARTPVIDVGTDAHRWQGMKSLERLNELSISRRNGVRVVAQKGYVPPPLEGIWARWPYFHNNAIPNLCVLLEVSANRPQVYYAVDAHDVESDFDLECNGYPSSLPAERQIRERRYDARRPGMGNFGHDQGILVRDGRELLTAQDKRDLIRFLQTL